MSDPIDKTLDEYLSGNSRISQRYRELDDAAVPPQLDQLVLAQARAAVAGQQAAHTEGHTDELARLRQRRKRLMRWSVPAGLAASAVLVVSIVMQSGVRHEVVSPQQITPQQVTVSAPAAVQEPSEQASDQERSVASTQPDASASAPRTAPPEASSDALTDQVEGKTGSNAKRLRQQQSAPLAVPAAPVPANQPALAPSVAAPAPPPPIAVSGSSRAAMHVPQDISEDIGHSTSSQAISSAAGEEAVARQATQARNDGLRAVAKTAAAQNQQAESRRAEPGADYDLSEVIVTGGPARHVSAAGSDPRGAVRQSAPAASQSDAAGTETQNHEEPKHWLERIRQLRKDGKAQDADREWQRFCEVYPDYAVAETDAARAKP